MKTIQQRGLFKPPLEMKLLDHDIVDNDFWSLLQLVYDYTELPINVLYNLYTSCRYIVHAGIDGDVIECGVYMGGSVMLMLHILKQLEREKNRRVFALDTFTGFTSRNEEIDIAMDGGHPVGIVDPSDDYAGPAIENMKSVGFPGLEIVKGDVLKTIPTLDTNHIALLRLDTDTHETTKFELEHLYDKVVRGGVVIVDDYGYNLGCKKAVDDFIVHKPILLQRINPNVRAWVKAL